MCDLSKKLAFINFFRQHGYSLEQSVGMTANFIKESDLDTNFYSQFTEKFGIGAWNGARLDNLNIYALTNNLTISTDFCQLAFIIFELDTTLLRVKNLLKTCKTVKEATECFADCYFVYVKSKQNIKDRVKIAEDLFKNL